MEDILHSRCFHHVGREAAARCPECRRFYCRECVTEHEDRVVCAACLRLIVGRRARRRARRSAFLLWVHAASAFAALWLLFYALGRGLLLLPTSFHEGTLWKEKPWAQP